MREYQEGDLVICTVKDVVKTTVFVETEDKVKGSINFSEVAPGRIRNIRDYVVPNKIIVCKVLGFRDNHLFLSFRRVKEKDRKELLELYKKGKSVESFIKRILGERGEQIIGKIKENEIFTEFFEEAKQKPDILEKYFDKPEIEKITSLLKEKKEKEKEIKREFSISCRESDGIIRLKRMLSPYDGIYYLGSSKFMIRRKTTDLKHTDSEINKVLETIEKQAKKEKCDFSIKK